MSAQTYSETVLRYRVMRHEGLPEAHKEAYRAEGIDPDDLWSLIWSFSDLHAAETCLAQEKADAPSIWTYKLVDAGGPTVIERSIW